MRSGEQRIVPVEAVVGIGRVGGAFDPNRVAATRDQQLRYLDEAFRAWSGDLRDRYLCRGCVGHGGEVGERLGDRAGGDELHAQVRHVADTVVPAPSTTGANS